MVFEGFTIEGSDKVMRYHYIQGCLPQPHIWWWGSLVFNGGKQVQGGADIEVCLTLPEFNSALKTFKERDRQASEAIIHCTY